MRWFGKLETSEIFWNPNLNIRVFLLGWVEIKFKRDSGVLKRLAIRQHNTAVDEFGLIGDDDDDDDDADDYSKERGMCSRNCRDYHQAQEFQ